MFHSRESKLAFVSRGMDALVILLTLRTAAALYGVSWTERYTIAVILAMLFFYVFGERHRLYHSLSGVSVDQSLWPMGAAWLWTSFGLFVVAWMTKATADYSRVTIGLWMVFVPVGLMGWRASGRLLLDTMHKRSSDTRCAAIAGANDHGERFARFLRSTPALDPTLAGFFDDRRPESGGARGDEGEPSVPLLGDLDALVERARAGQLDLVFIALPMKAEERIDRLITRLSDTKASIYVILDPFAHGLAHSRWTSIGPFPMISVFESPFAGTDGWTKRLEDVGLSIFFLIVTALPMLLIATAIKLASQGPVLFKQRRYGLDGREITMWKFRTMTVQEDGDSVVQARRGDDRVTPLGAFLRRTSLDELPQFFNVLLGDMSIVGPRPHAIAHNEQYRRLIPGYMLRHRIKPGITGWAQINGWRGETDTVEKMEGRIQFDLWYIRSWSLWLDLRIIARTAWLVFGDRNAW